MYDDQAAIVHEWDSITGVTQFAHGEVLAVEDRCIQLGHGLVGLRQLGAHGGQFPALSKLLFAVQNVEHDSTPADGDPVNYAIPVFLARDALDAEALHFGSGGDILLDAGGEWLGDEGGDCGGH